MNTMTAINRCRTDAPICPVCEGLECVCRPRFFAGQRLSERELNDLVAYLKSKQRLQNRYLHGWGTVCGLEVSCDPCGNSVRVSPGYAIDPCGEDIVVCEPDTVDVCKLIKDCCDKERDPCRPYGRASECDDVEQKWILAIKYEETPSRGIVPLIARGGAKTSCGCGSSPCNCGGKGSCSCGGGISCSCGGSKGKTKGVAVTPPRDAPAQCEPTQICEGYRYEVYRLPDEGDDKRKPDPNDRKSDFKDLFRQVFCGLDGPMFERLCCCIDPLLDTIPKQPTVGTDTRAGREAWYRWCCKVKMNLVAYMQQHPVFDCEMMKRLQAAQCPSPDLPADEFAKQIATGKEWLAVFLVEAIIACLCSALLPQCPAPAHDARVPLAVITVRGKNCEVVDVCNWTPHRRILLTWQTMAYWFSWIPFFKGLRNGIHELCCTLFGIKIRMPRLPRSTTVPFDTTVGNFSAAMQPMMMEAGPRLASGAFIPSESSLAATALMRMPRLPVSMSPSDLADALFGQRKANETIAISDPDIAMAPEFRVLNHLAAPFVSNLGVEGLMALVGPGAGDLPGAPAAKETDVVELKQQMQTLQETLKSQAALIEKLSARLDKQG